LVLPTARTACGPQDMPHFLRPHTRGGFTPRPDRFEVELEMVCGNLGFPNS